MYLLFQCQLTVDIKTAIFLYLSLTQEISLTCNIWVALRMNDLPLNAVFQLKSHLFTKQCYLYRVFFICGFAMV